MNHSRRYVSSASLAVFAILGSLDLARAADMPQAWYDRHPAKASASDCRNVVTFRQDCLPSYAIQGGSGGSSSGGNSGGGNSGGDGGGTGGGPPGGGSGAGGNGAGGNGGGN